MVKYHMVTQVSCVEAWTDKRPYCGAGPESTQCRRQPYHQSLCAAIRNLGASVASSGGLRASWMTERRGSRDPDAENLLIWDVRSSLPRVTDFLSFERHIGSLPPPPKHLEFRAGHYLRYEAVSPPFVASNSRVLAECRPIACRSDDLEITFELWRRFKRNVVCTNQGRSWSPRNPFDVEITIFGPEQVNLADWQMVKSVVDAFIMSLHYYAGKQTDDVSNRIKEGFGGEAAYWRELLLDHENAVLGSCNAPYLKQIKGPKSKGLAWSPADDLLVRCEFAQKQSPDGGWSAAGRLIGR